MRRSISRTAALALCVTLALGAAAVPCAAGDTAATNTGGALTRLSPASLQVLATATPRLASPKPRSGEGAKPQSGDGRTLGATATGQPASAPGTQSSFFKTTRGKVTLALMGAGVGLTLWSIHDSRKPVKSPVR